MIASTAGPPIRAEPPWVWPRAAYVHIPFCAHKCGYCDFASLAGVDHLADRYLDALGREMARARASLSEVDTIFIGGGTPTRLDARQLDRLLAMIRRLVPARPRRRVDRRGQPRARSTPRRPTSWPRAA